MRQTTIFTFGETDNEVLAVCGMGILGIWWIIISALSYLGIAVATSAKFWIVVAVFLACIKNISLYRTIFSGASLMHHMRTPRHLWNAYLTAAFAKTAALWGILVLGSALLVYTSIPKWEVASMLACFSMLLCISTISALSNYKRWTRFLPLILNTAALFAITTIWLKIDVEPLFDKFNQVPMLIRLALSFTWPILVWCLLKTWHDTPPVQPPDIKDSQQGIGRAISDWTHRFKLLAATDPIFRYQESKTNWGKFSALLTPQIILMPHILSPNINMGLDGISLARIVYLFCVGLCFSSALVFKDLHWRLLLCPGALQRGKIGWHIFSYSALLQLLAFAMFSGIGVLVKILFFEKSNEEIWAQCWSQRTIPFEILFSVSVSVCFGQQFLKLIKRNKLVNIPTTIVGMVLMLFCSEYFKWMIPDWQYLVWLCLVTLCLVLWANSLWTTQRIAATLHASN